MKAVKTILCFLMLILLPKPTNTSLPRLFWNLGVPSILKAYFDYITVKDISFKYTAEGPVGLLKNKSALYVSARGGKYDTEPMSNFEFGERYIKTILNFLGVVNYSAIFADGVDIMGADIKQIINTAVEKAAKLAEIF